MSFRFQKQTQRSSLIPCISPVLPFIFTPPNPIIQLLLILSLFLGSTRCSFCSKLTFLPPFSFFPSLLLPSCHLSVVNLAAIKSQEMMANFCFYILALVQCLIQHMPWLNYNVNVPYIQYWFIPKRHFKIRVIKPSEFLLNSI